MPELPPMLVDVDAHQGGSRWKIRDLSGSPCRGDPSTLALYAEDASGATVALTARWRRGFGRSYVMMFTETVAQVAAWDRPPAYHRALLWLLAALDPLQPRAVSAREVALGCNISINSAARALAMLEADRVVIGVGQTAAKRRRLNNRLAWRSRVERFEETPEDTPPEDARGR